MGKLLQNLHAYRHVPTVVKHSPYQQLMAALVCDVL